MINILSSISISNIWIVANTSSWYSLIDEHKGEEDYKLKKQLNARTS
jgi:hypothetical protein